MASAPAGLDEVELSSLKVTGHFRRYIYGFR